MRYTRFIFIKNLVSNSPLLPYITGFLYDKKDSLLLWNLLYAYGVKNSTIQTDITQYAVRAVTTLFAMKSAVIIVVLVIHTCAQNAWMNLRTNQKRV